MLLKVGHLGEEAAALGELSAIGLPLALPVP